MKTALLALAAILPFTAQANFIPGRVRTEALAPLKVMAGSHPITQAKSLQLSAQIEDGQPGYVGYTLLIDGQATKFKVTKSEDTGCAQVSETMMDQITTMQEQVVMKVTDYSNSKCEMVVPYLWQVEFSTRNISSGEEHSVIFGGAPQHFLHTM